MKINKEFLNWYDDKKFVTFVVQRISKYAQDDEFLIQSVTSDFASVFFNMIEKWDSRSIHLFVHYLRFKLNHAIYQEDKAEKEAELCWLYLMTYDLPEKYSKLYDSIDFGRLYAEINYALLDLVHKDYVLLRKKTSLE